MESVAGSIQLPQTGQTTCYDASGTAITCSGTGQDGDVKAGVSWSNPRFTDNGDQTVMDNLTGLMWTKDAHAPGPAACSPGATKTWQSALDYVKCLNTNQYLGYTDWRLPNINELASLVNVEQANLAAWLNAQGFVNVQAASYWSSTSCYGWSNAAGRADWDKAYQIDMTDGFLGLATTTDGGDTKSANHYVWPTRTGQSGIVQLPQTGQATCYDASGTVITCSGTGQDGDLRAGVAWPSTRFMDNGNQTVTDNLTGLMWSKDGNAPGPTACSPGATKTWQSALDYVKCLNTNQYLGYTDWRLPNRREGGSLSHRGQTSFSAWMTSQGFINVPTYYYWSSTTYTKTPSIGWILSGGKEDTYSKSYSYSIWPVRAGQVTTCTYTVSPTSYAHSASGNTGTVTVTSSSSTCAWTATTTDSWITITSGASVTGTGTVSYSVIANTGSARIGTITVGGQTFGGQTFTITQAGWTYSNSVGPRNSIKITDMSGSLSSSGASITVSAWDTNGTSIPESSSAISLKLYSNGTTTISGTDLRDSFPTGTPMTYALSADSAKYIITNVKSSSDNTLNVPNGCTSGTTKFVANSVGPRNSIKITDMSGTLSTPAAITVNAWDASGISIPEATSAIPLTLSNNGTTTITGNELIARFPTTAPMSYEFTIGSSKYVITNVKSSADGTINIPYAYTSGTTTFVANSIGPRNTIKISDVSGSLSSSGAAITVAAWDINGNAIPESATAALKLYSRGTTIITGTALAARFTGGTPMAYEFTVSSSKYIITNIKSSSDSSISIPAVYTSGTTMYASNDISFLSTIKITDASGSLSSPAAITVNVWDVNGNSIAESTSAIPLTLVSNGTTTITGTNLIARFPTGTPALYEFTIGSTKYLVTNVTSNTAGTITIPGVYSSGVAGGI